MLRWPHGLLHGDDTYEIGFHQDVEFYRDPVGAVVEDLDVVTETPIQVASSYTHEGRLALLRPRQEQHVLGLPRCKDPCAEGLYRQALCKQLKAGQSSGVANEQAVALPRHDVAVVTGDAEDGAADEPHVLPHRTH